MWWLILSIALSVAAEWEVKSVGFVTAECDLSPECRSLNMDGSSEAWSDCLYSSPCPLNAYAFFNQSMENALTFYPTDNSFSIQGWHNWLHETFGDSVKVEYEGYAHLHFDSDLMGVSTIPYSLEDTTGENFTGEDISRSGEITTRRGEFIVESPRMAYVNSAHLMYVDTPWLRIMMPNDVDVKSDGVDVKSDDVPLKPIALTFDNVQFRLTVMTAIEGASHRMIFSILTLIVFLV